MNRKPEETEDNVKFTHLHLLLDKHEPDKPHTVPEEALDKLAKELAIKFYGTEKDKNMRLSEQGINDLID